MSDRQAFRSQARQVAVKDPIWDPCYCAVREEDAMSDALFAPLSSYRRGASKLTGISNKTISRVKADSENAVLAPRIHEETGWCFSGFGKCEIYINCKIIRNKQDNKLL